MVYRDYRRDYGEEEGGISEWNMAQATCMEIRRLFSTYNEAMIDEDYNFAYKILWQVMDEISPFITSHEIMKEIEALAIIITNNLKKMSNSKNNDEKRMIGDKLHYDLTKLSRILKRVLHKARMIVPMETPPEEAIEETE